MPQKTLKHAITYSILSQSTLHVKDLPHQSDVALHQSHPHPPSQAVHPNPPPIISYQFSKHILPQEQM
jgi:hypothetical protein